jgi:predicted 2-oxoglutarate/Fe(II)-dependent dioxygenase YbiX
MLAALLAVCLAGKWDDEDCPNNHPECASWAAKGECEKNPGYMKWNCQKSCGCQEPARIRCRRPPDLKPAMLPGSVSAAFEAAAAMEELGPVVLSRDPPIIEFTDFLTEDELTEYLHTIKTKADGWQRSGAGGYGTMKVRTSSTSFCTGKCDQSPMVQKVLERAALVSSHPKENIEYVQFVNYSVGQFFGKHEDSRDSYRYAPQGTRTFSLFVYLSDTVSGGATSFPKLNVKVFPRKRHAVLFANVRDDDPNSTDTRSTHEGEPVTEGYKLASNIWIYNYDYRAADAKRCTDIHIADQLQKVVEDEEAQAMRSKKGKTRASAKRGEL